ncbi:hypothetical protein HGA64_00760 [Candidatus Falkowbacteria bacterium]|nr:hypothetical protein [Candidatus Falkowbacteria bacterium]
MEVSIISTPGAEGNFFVDDVKVKPALQIKNAAPNNYVGDSCRLYPKSEALSCQYRDNEGVTYNGWKGYCMEYDRYPGLNNACLMWWPVDKVNGDTFGRENTFKGYDGKYPAYYCAELDGNYRYVEKRSAGLVAYRTKKKSCFWGDFINIFLTGGMISSVFGFPGLLGPSIDLFDFNGSTANGTNAYCPVGAGYLLQTYVDNCHCGFFDTSCTTRYYTYCLPASRKYNIPGEVNNEWAVTSGGSQTGGGAWYQFNGTLMKWRGLELGSLTPTNFTSEIDNGVRILDLGATSTHADDKLVDPSKYDYLPCKKFYETVSENGENKVWLGRLGVDSNYTPVGLGYEYKQDDAPYGSAVPPSPLGNPYDWDSSTKAGRQPISFKLETSEVRAGSPYSCVGDKCGKVGHCSDSGKTCVSLIPSTQNMDLCNQHPATLLDPVDPPTTPPGNIMASGVAGQYDCYLAINSALTTTNIDVYATVCQAGCTPASSPTCNCITDSTGLPAPNSTATVCHQGAGPTASLCVPPTCTSGAAATCVNNVIGTIATSTFQAGGPSDDNTYGKLNIATSTNPNIRSYDPPAYGCNNDEDCITTPLPDWPQASTIVAETTNVPAMSNLQRMFAKNYGVWVWNPSTRHYERGANADEYWDAATDALPCNGTGAGPRPAYPNDYCRITPIISNIAVDKNTINGSGPVKLTFNTHVDVNQLPLIHIRIDWGDGSNPTIINGEFSDRTNVAYPHEYYHSYTHSGFTSCPLATCQATPTITIMDNWGTPSAATSNPTSTVSVTAN